MGVYHNGDNAPAIWRDANTGTLMQKFEVGTPFEPGITSYEEIAQYSCRSGMHFLILPLANISQAEMKAVTEGNAYFAFTTIGDVLIFQYRFGAALSWSDSAYNWYLVPEEERELPRDPGEEGHPLLSVILIEATNGLVAGLRLVSFSPTFARELRDALVQQASRPKPTDFIQQARRIFVRYSSKQLRRMALSSCIGGDDYDRPAPF
jgi:hypothetical protein